MLSLVVRCKQRSSTSKVHEKYERCFGLRYVSKETTVIVGGTDVVALVQGLGDKFIKPCSTVSN